MPRLLHIAAAIIDIWWLIRRFNALPAAQRNKFAFQVFLGFVIVALLVLAMRGRLNWLFALGAAVIPLLPRMPGCGKLTPREIRTRTPIRTAQPWT